MYIINVPVSWHKSCIRKARFVGLRSYSMNLHMIKLGVANMLAFFFSILHLNWLITLYYCLSFYIQHFILRMPLIASTGFISWIGQPYWANFSLLGHLFTLGSFLKITEATYFHRKNFKIMQVQIFTKNGLGLILGDFFTSSSCHTAHGPSSSHLKSVIKNNVSISYYVLIKICQ
jgi:hypothetical protein